MKSGLQRGGYIKNINYYDIKAITFRSNGIYFEGDHKFIDTPVGYSTPSPIIDGINIKRVSGFGLRAGNLLCIPEAPCKNVNMENVVLDTIEGFICENVHGNHTNVRPPLCY